MLGGLSPEMHILGMVIVFFALAYLFIYPRQQVKTLRRLIVVDAILLVALLVIAASVYLGKGVAFTLVFFDTWWWLYTLVVAMVVVVVGTVVVVMNGGGAVVEAARLGASS